MVLKRIILPIIFSFFVSTKPVNFENAAVVGGAIVTGFCAWKIVKWWSYKTAEQLLANAHLAYGKSREFEAALNFVNQEYTSAERDSQTGYQIVRETALWNLLPCINGNLAKFQGSLGGLIYQLKYSTKLLRKKRDNYNRGSDKDKTYYPQVVDSFLVELEVTLKNLNFLSQFLNYHESYFKGVIFGKKFAEEVYEKEIQIIVDAGNRTDLISRARCKYSEKSYPLISYCHQLSKDILLLESTHSKMGNKYSWLMASANQLEQNLKFVLDEVKSSSEYDLEKSRKRQEDLWSSNYSVHCMNFSSPGAAFDCFASSNLNNSLKQNHMFSYNSNLNNSLKQNYLFPYK